MTFTHLADDDAAIELLKERLQWFGGAVPDVAT